MEDLFVPEYLDMPWLTAEYISNNGWHPVPDEWLNYDPEMQFQDTRFGSIPWKSRKEFRPGDVIIFDEYNEWLSENGTRCNDRFYTVDKRDIKEYERKKRLLLPVGVVVHPPEE